jgi:putative aldouronate transport system permease protein
VPYRDRAIRAPTVPRRFPSRIGQNVYLYLMLVPVVAYYAIFHYAPMYGLVMAFQNFKPFKRVLGSPWVGFENFRVLFTGPYFVRLLRNTLLLNLYDLAFGFPAPIVLALVFNEIGNLRFKKVTQTISYLPYFISIVILTGLVVNFLSPSTGVVNAIIKSLGGTPVYFLADPRYFRLTYTIMNIWKNVGFGSILYMAALAGIDPQLYEAAVVDGGNRWHQAVHVTLPGIAPTIIIMLILRLGQMLSVGFESIVNLYNPAIYETSDVINTYVYRVGLQGSGYSLATAAGFFQSVVSLALVAAANEISKRVSDTHLW